MCCPQFAGYDDDQTFNGVEFSRVPNKGYAAVINFWKEDKHLFGLGYLAEAPPEVQQMFKDIDKVIAKAIKNYFKK